MNRYLHLDCGGLQEGKHISYNSDSTLMPSLIRRHLIFLIFDAEVVLVVPLLVLSLSPLMGASLL